MTLLPLIVFCFWIGLYPKPFFAILDEPVTRLVEQVNKTHVYPDRVVDLRPAVHDPARVVATIEPLDPAPEAENEMP